MGVLELQWIWLYASQFYDFLFSGSSVIGIVFGIIFIDIGLQGAYIKSNPCLFDTT
jgi:hypothetical protein